MTHVLDFPTVSYSDALRFVDAHRQPDGPAPASPEIQIDQAPLGHSRVADVFDVVNEFMVMIGSEFSRLHAKYTQRDELEGLLCEYVYDGLRELPTAILTSVGFWRYLATRSEMFEFAAWRDENLRERGSLPGNESFGVASPTSLHRDTVPWRMFNRALISTEAASINGRERMEAAQFVGSEMWKSHTMRVGTSFAPVYVAEILASLGSESGALTPSDIRESAKKKTGLNFPKRVTRLNTNIVAETLGVNDAAHTVTREVERLRTTRAAAKEGHK